MANNKIGLAYFNIDTDRYQDIRIKKLKRDFSCSGIAVYDYLLCEIYRVRGSFLEWDESRVFDVADYFNVKESLVNEIVDYCCIVGLFDKNMLTNKKILTSLSIQKRYTDICVRSKRKNVNTPEQWRIIPENSGSLSENSGSLKQSKVKRSKVKRSKEENIPPNTKMEESISNPNNNLNNNSKDNSQDNPLNHSLEHSQQVSNKKQEKEKNSAKKEKFAPPTRKELEQYLVKADIESVNTDNFLDYYTSNGWIVGKTKMKDWKATVRLWNTRNKTYEKTNSTEYDRRKTTPVSTEYATKSTI